MISKTKLNPVETFILSFFLLPLLDLVLFGLTPKKDQSAFLNHETPLPPLFPLLRPPLKFTLHHLTSLPLPRRQRRRLERRLQHHRSLPRSTMAGSYQSQQRARDYRLSFRLKFYQRHRQAKQLFQRQHSWVRCHVLWQQRHLGSEC